MSCYINVILYYIWYYVIGFTLQRSLPHFLLLLSDKGVNVLVASDSSNPSFSSDVLGWKIEAAMLVSDIFVYNILLEVQSNGLVIYLLPSHFELVDAVCKFSSF